MIWLHLSTFLFGDQGVKIDRDSHGNIYLTRLSDCNIFVKGFSHPHDHCIADDVVRTSGRIGLEKTKVVRSAQVYLYSLLFRVEPTHFVLYYRYFCCAWGNITFMKMMMVGFIMFVVLLLFLLIFNLKNSIKNWALKQERVAVVLYSQYRNNRVEDFL